MRHSPYSIPGLEFSKISLKCILLSFLNNRIFNLITPFFMNSMRTSLKCDVMTRKRTAAKRDKNDEIAIHKVLLRCKVNDFGNYNIRR